MAPFYTQNLTFPNRTHIPHQKVLYGNFSEHIRERTTEEHASAIFFYVKQKYRHIFKPYNASSSQQRTKNLVEAAFLDEVGAPKEVRALCFEIYHNVQTELLKYRQEISENLLNIYYKYREKTIFYFKFVEGAVELYIEKKEIDNNGVLIESMDLKDPWKIGEDMDVSRYIHQRGVRVENYLITINKQLVEEYIGKPLADYIMYLTRQRYQHIVYPKKLGTPP